MRASSLLLQSIAAVISVALTIQPIYAYAQQGVDPRIVGEQAKELGRGLGESFKNNPTQYSGNTLTLPEGKDGQFGPGGGMQFGTNELLPSTHPDASEPASYYAPEGTPGVGDLEAVFGSDEDMDEMGRSTKELLWQDASRENPGTLTGKAYQILLGFSSSSIPDLSNDPVFAPTREGVFGQMDLWEEGFGDCSVRTVVERGTRDAHVPEYERCQRVMDKSASCTVHHHYNAGVMTHSDGPYNLAPCGEGCYDLWIGRVGDNYWSGNCTIYEQVTQVKVNNPMAVRSAVLDHAKWDDYMQIWVGKPGQEVKVWQSSSNFPPETGGRCDLESSRAVSPGLDVTQHFKSVQPGDVVNFKIRVSVGGKGEGYGRIKIRYDADNAVYQDEWVPQDCIDSAIGLVDGYAEGSMTCTDKPTTDTNGCTTLNGVKVCPSDLDPSPLRGISNLCRKVEVKANYNFYKGQMDCWTDPQGETHCPDNQGGNLNSCTEYEASPQCAFVSTECVDGAEGASGNCYLYTDTYDCGYSYSIPTLEKNEEYECGGEIRCMGDDCLAATRTQSEDFAKAVALLNAAQFMTQDMTCTGLDEEGNPIGDEDVVCSAFGGTPGECKIAVGGVQDCCEKPKNISLADYLQLIMSVPKLDAGIMALEEGNVVRGAYQTLRQPITQGWNEVTKPFASYAENITGAVDNFFQPVEEFVDKAVEKLTEQIQKIMADVFKSAGQDAATEKAATSAATEATESLANGAASWMSTVSTIYTAYVVTMVMIQMVWKCEEEEFTMNAQRQLKNCTYVGDYCKSDSPFGCIEKREAYCCFNSPLSRIIQEQVRGQLGRNFGSARNPECGGIPLDQIADIDWERVDLDEWLGILQANGQFPSSHEDLNLETLTGAGSPFNTDGDRLSAGDRAAARLDGIDVDAKRREAMEVFIPETGGPAF